jgi:hypothetical protein
MTLSWRGGRGWRCTKFEVNRTNIEWVTLPAAPSVSSGDLVPDVRLTSADVRADVTTKLGIADIKETELEGRLLQSARYARILSAKWNVPTTMTPTPSHKCTGDDHNMIHYRNIKSNVLSLVQIRGTQRQKWQKRNHLMYGTLKIVYQVYHSKEESKKKKIKVF